MTQNTEQNVQTQDAQVETLAFEIALWGKSNLHERRVVAEKNLKEAEARGAEEQRRKDGEGQEPVVWIKQSELNYDWPIGAGVWRSCQLREFTIPLYTRPANVAALEARIAELVEAATDAIALIREGRPVLARSALQRVTTDQSSRSKDGSQS